LGWMMAQLVFTAQDFSALIWTPPAT